MCRAINGACVCTEGSYIVVSTGFDISARWVSQRENCKQNRDLIQRRTENADASRPNFPPEVMQVMDEAVRTASVSIADDEAEYNRLNTTVLVLQHAPALLLLVEELVAMPEFTQLNKHLHQQLLRQTFNAGLRD